MSTESATTETPAGEASPGAAAAPVAERPAWLGEDPHGFWDGDKGDVKAEALYKSFEDTKRLIGSRVGDLGIEARRKLAEMLPDTLRDTWESELRAKLVADPEFLTPLEEAWKTAHLKAAPEAYEVPALGENVGLNPEHPLYAKATELARKHGLDQDSFSEMMAFVTEAQADTATALSGATEEAWRAAIPELEQRTGAVHNRLKSLAPEHARTLLENVRDPNAFLALEAVIKATSSKPLALEAGTAPETLDKATLDKMVLDPLYSTDKAFYEKVTKGFQRLYGEHL